VTGSASFLLCPGRGSYGRAELGCLHRAIEGGGKEVASLVDELEAHRARFDPTLPSIMELDGAAQFKAGLHLPGRNSSPLIFAASLVSAKLEPSCKNAVLIGGNSLGFYTALVLCAALSVAEGYRLISTMARLMEEGPGGGQILWTLLDEDWNVLPERLCLLHEVLQHDEVGLSIRLGGHVVLAAGDKGLAYLRETLPQLVLGERSFPFQLPFHGPFHTPLLESVARRAQSELASLAMQAPRRQLIDGRGKVWAPLRTDPEELTAYTLGEQVTSSFDFTGMLRAGICDFAPDEITLLGPGSSLRAPLGHVQSWLERGWVQHAW